MQARHTLTHSRTLNVVSQQQMAAHTPTLTLLFMMG